jgi:esterase/lipase superfamily enzyme
MHRSYHHWHSQALGRTMELLVFGHAGAPVLVFPTSRGRFYEYEDRGMVDALGHSLQQGWIQLICVDSIDEESWYNYGAGAGTRLFRHDQYEHYLLTEVLPFVRSINQTAYLIVTGCSFGASQAINFAFRHPGVVNRVIGLSGLYDLRRFFGGDSHESIYYHNPVEYLANLSDEQVLGQMRKMDIIMAIGQDDAAAWSNDRISQILWSKGIWHALRLWSGWSHDWPYWQQMINLYISGHD